MNEPKRSLVPVIIGIAATAVLLLALAYVANKRRSELGAAPSLALLAPAPGAAVDSPLVVRFQSSRPISLTPAGWSADGLHLHAWVNGMQYMPAAADIRDVPGGYAWTLPMIRRDNGILLHLGWANAAHRPIAAGATPEVEFDLR